MAELKCPYCEATLRSVSLRPGAMIRCLNCNRKFSPAHSDPSAGMAAQAESHSVEAALPAQPPGTPTYVLPRVMGGLAGTAVAILTAIGGQQILHYMNGSKIQVHELWQISFLPVLFWLSWFLWRLPGALSRLDAAHTQWAWKQGVLRGPLPRPPGSSLPFMLPTAVTLGLLALALTLEGVYREEATFRIFIGGTLAALAVGLGMAFDDFRLFLWRQQTLAQLLMRSAQAPKKIFFPYRIIFPNFFGVISLASFLLALLLIWDQESQYRYRGDSYVLFWSLSIAIALGVGYTLLRLTSALQDCAGQWRDAALIMRPSVGADASRDALISVILMMIRIGILMGAYLYLDFLRREYGYDRGHEKLNLFFLSLALITLALFLGSLLLRLHTWRRSQAQALGLSPGGKKITSPSLFSLSLFWILAGSCSFLGVCTLSKEFIISMNWLSNSHRTTQAACAFTLIWLSLTMVLLWLGAMAREVFLGMRQAERAVLASEPPPPG